MANADTATVGPTPARAAASIRRLADLTLPELRRMLVTTMLFVIVLVLFLWMVRTVIIATILGVIVAVFMRPVLPLAPVQRSATGTAAATHHAAGAHRADARRCSCTATSRSRDVAAYVAATPGRDRRQDRRGAATAARSCGQASISANRVRQYVIAASDYGTRHPGRRCGRRWRASPSRRRSSCSPAYYVLVDAERIGAYLRVQDSAALRRAVARARVERARRAVRRDLLDAR